MGFRPIGENLDRKGGFSSFRIDVSHNCGGFKTVFWGVFPVFEAKKRGILIAIH